MGEFDIYISGLSCRFPESDNANEFFQNLLNKKDMVTEDSRRWKKKRDDFCQKFGKIKQSLTKFDHQFFGVTGKQAERTDPQLRLLLEVAYEALVDAGVELSDIKGSKTGVYVGGAISDAYEGWTRNLDSISGYESAGCTPCMLSNRISYALDLRGPSETIDTACSSSLVAFHRAVSDLEKGVCDHAIVGGSLVILKETTTFALHKFKALSPDGICRSFDKSANGFARSEAIAVVFLTKKRETPFKPYAKVLATGTNNGGWNPSGISYPNGALQQDLYRFVCQKANIRPKEIDYVEAHGTGTVAGDGEELEAIYQVYGKENDQLIVGSVKSNMGHTENASGLAGIIKTVLSMEQGILPPNLHLKDPHEKLKNMRVMTDAVTPWNISKAAISSFGIGGTNAHVILENYKENASAKKGSALLDLTLLSSRTKEGLYRFKKVCPKDLPVPNLENRQKLPYREVLELADDPDVSNIADAEDKVYIACSGNGSQWKGMGLGLYAGFPIFRETIDACGKSLGVNLYDILSKGFDNPKDATVALAAIQIGLIELIKCFGISEERIGGFFGHSAGEIVCSYLDNLTSLEETMQIAHSRGLVAQMTGNQGLMASIGLPYEKMTQMILDQRYEKEVCIACVNSANNMTISGTKEGVLALVELANQKEIFTRVLDTYGTAYHSPIFMKHKGALEEVLKRAMGAKSSVRSGKWTSSVSQFAPEKFDYTYHVEGVLRSVDFIKTTQNIPKNAVVLEIGPHSILKTLIRENRMDLKYVSLMKKETNEIETLKEGMGKLWKYGINIDLKKEPAVHRQRPPLDVRSFFVSWDHTQDFPLPDFSANVSSQYKVVYDFSKEKDRYIQGHIVDAKTILPASLYVCSLWEVFRKVHDLQISDFITYEFSNFEIIQSVQVEKDSIVELEINHMGNQYELLFRDETIARVNIDLGKNKHWTPVERKILDQELSIDKDNFYRIVKAYGYQYEGAFQIIQKLKCDAAKNKNYAEIKWDADHWISFLDGVFQSQLVAPKSCFEKLAVPVRIGSIRINPQFFLGEVKRIGNIQPLISDFDLGYVAVSGIEVSGMETKELRSRKQEEHKKFSNKLANDIYFYGRREMQEALINDYSLTVTNYAIQKCRDLIHQKNLGGVGHYQRILKSFETWKHYAKVDQNLLDYFRKKPECIALRILEDVYAGDYQEFIENPLAVSTQHPEHGQLYFVDPIASIFDKKVLLKMMSIVRENVGNIEMNILEIGTGTGGFTRSIAPYIMNDKFVITDITETSQIIPDPGIEHIHFTYEKFDLNDAQAYGLIKKHNIDLVLGSCSWHTANNFEKMLKGVYDNLREGGFAIIYEVCTPFCLALWGMDSRLWSFEEEREYGLWISQESWIKKLHHAGFEIISYHTDKSNVATLFFVRKPLRIKLEAMQAPSIDRFGEWSLKIKNCNRHTLLVSRTMEQSGVLGFIRCLNREVDGNYFYGVMSDREITKEDIRQIEKISLQSNVIEKNQLGTVCSSELEYRPIVHPDRGFHLKFGTTGDFSTYEWHSNPPPQEIQCKVKYAALNFKDVMLGSGKLLHEKFNGRSLEQFLGCEFSGTDPKGTPVMGFTKRGIASHVDVRKDYMIPIPPQFSLEEAATLPIVYVTAYYGLFDRANIQPGQSVLIHAGAGGVGQAAIHICLSLGCQIFTTCHQSKKGALQKIFPQLNPSMILDSRTADFEGEILKQTQGRGVDIVLNCLSGDKLHASLRCVARNGHFVEIGRYDIQNHTPLDMNTLAKNVTIHGIDYIEDHAEKLLIKVEEGIRKGVVKPISYQVFDSSEVEETFRFMGSGKHIGKILLKMDGLESQKASDRFRFSTYYNEKEDGYVLVTGGLGGFGLSLLQWLFSKGARKFLITSRKTISTGEQERVIHLLRSLGAEMILSTKNVANKSEAQDLVKLVGGKIKSVFHLAMSLEDVLFKNMTQEKWEKAVDIKAKGAIHLDELTRIASVEHFVVFSSVAARYGNSGQSNYIFGNSVMEEICRQRLGSGYHAIAMQWGYIDDAGYVASNADVAKNSRKLFEPISMKEALQFIDDVLANKINSHSVHYRPISVKINKESYKQMTFEDVFLQINNIMKMDLLKCSLNDRLEVLGADSLQLVEIQTILIKVIQEVLPLKKIGGMQIGALRKLIETRLGEGKPKDQEIEKQEAAALDDAPFLKSMNLCDNKVDTSVYLFLGLGVKGDDLKFPKSDRFHIKLVQWENGASIESIAKAIESDIQGGRYRRVKFLTHSAGSQIAKAVKNLSKERIDDWVAISMINEKIIEGWVSKVDIQNMLEGDFLNIYKNFAFYTENHLPIGKIKQQAVLLKNTLKYKYLPPNLMLYPKRDPLCDRSGHGIEIEGSHEATSFQMEEIYAHI